MREFGDRPEALGSKGDNWTQNEQRLRQAQDMPMAAGGDDLPPPSSGDSPSPPGHPLEGETFRYYDPKLDGEVRTHLERPNALEPEAVATLHDRDGGSVREVGRLRYALDMEDCMLRGYTQPPETFGVESALQSEVSERAREAGVHNMQVWSQDGESPKSWSSHGFLENARNRGAQGVHWNRRL